jgi:hypothetical protein
MDIPNRGNEPIFVISDRKDVVDLTTQTNLIGNLGRDWHVSEAHT